MFTTWSASYRRAIPVPNNTNRAYTTAWAAPPTGFRQTSSLPHTFALLHEVANIHILSSTRPQDILYIAARSCRHPSRGYLLQMWSLCECLVGLLMLCYHCLIIIIINKVTLFLSWTFDCGLFVNSPRSLDRERVLPHCTKMYGYNLTISFCIDIFLHHCQECTTDFAVVLPWNTCAFEQILVATAGTYLCVMVRSQTCCKKYCLVTCLSRTF